MGSGVTLTKLGPPASRGYEAIILVGHNNPWKPNFIYT